MSPALFRTKERDALAALFGFFQSDGKSFQVPFLSCGPLSTHLARLSEVLQYSRAGGPGRAGQRMDPILLSPLTRGKKKRSPALPRSPVSVLPLSCATDRGHKKMGLEGNSTPRALTFLIATWKQKSQGWWRWWKKKKRIHREEISCVQDSCSYDHIPAHPTFFLPYTRLRLL